MEDIVSIIVNNGGNGRMSRIFHVPGLSIYDDN